MDLYSEMESEMGLLRIAYNTKGITMVCPANSSGTEFENVYRRRFGARIRKGKLPDAFRRALAQAIAGRSFDPVPLDLSGLTDFQRKVLKILQRVPRGKVRTYSWLARRAGRPGAARAAGNAMALNPIPFLIPCHRIVPAAGGIGKYGLGSAIKRILLEREGVDPNLLR
jgi:methylated-DNA-[protein]-cysteine S-methyltransferase